MTPKETYFHGGPAGLPIGARLLPAAESGHAWTDQQAVELLDTEHARAERDHDMRFVHFTTQRDVALAYAELYAAARSEDHTGALYSVKPLGPVRTHHADGSQFAPSAIVVSVVNSVQMSAAEAGIMARIVDGMVKTWVRRR